MTEKKSFRRGSRSTQVPAYTTIYDIGNPEPGLRQTDNTTRPIESLTYNLYVLYKIGEEIIIMKKKLLKFGLYRFWFT
jgi:hypothetical protein